MVPGHYLFKLCIGQFKNVLELPYNCFNCQSLDGHYKEVFSLDAVPPALSIFCSPHFTWRHHTWDLPGLPSIFTHWKQSNIGGGEDLGLRLVLFFYVLYDDLSGYLLIWPSLRDCQQDQPGRPGWEVSERIHSLWNWVSASHAEI